MKQNYRAVLCDGKKFRWLDPEAFSAKGQLCKHSSLGGAFTNAVYLMLDNAPMRVGWIGELSNDPFDPDEDAYAGALPEEEFMRYYAEAWTRDDWKTQIVLGNLDRNKLSQILTLRTNGRYLVNHTRMTYLDMGVYIPSNLSALQCPDPLPLLTACGNGRGDGEYPFGNSCSDKIGAWAFNLLSFTDKKPEGFQEETILFKLPGPDGLLKGKRIVVTGTAPHYTRSEMEQLIHRAGGIAANSVTRKTDFLVVADKPGATKLRDADKYGIRKVPIGDFMKML